MKFAIFLSFFVATVTANSAFYDDSFARQLLSISAGGFSKDPIVCVRKTFPDGNWKVFEHDTVYNGNLKGNLTVFALTNDETRQIIFAFAAQEPSNEKSLVGLIKYNDPTDFRDYGSVNSIFLELESSVWAFVHRVVAFQDLHSYSATFTGYSIGGAVATLAAMQTVFEGHRKSSHITLITFGEPRVGNFIFASSVDRELPNIYRITHRKDPIVHFPPCMPNGKYACTSNEPEAPHHHGTEIFYDNDMRYNADFLRCTFDDEDSNCSNSLRDQTDFVDHEYYFQHKVISYGEHDCTDVEGAQQNSAFITSPLPTTVFLSVSLSVLHYF